MHTNNHEIIITVKCFNKFFLTEPLSLINYYQATSFECSYFMLSCDMLVIEVFEFLNSIFGMNTIPSAGVLANPNLSQEL